MTSYFTQQLTVFEDRAEKQGGGVPSFQPQLLDDKSQSTVPQPGQKRQPCKVQSYKELWSDFIHSYTFFFNHLCNFRA